jgi:hypothetical protein
MTIPSARDRRPATPTAWAVCVAAWLLPIVPTAARADDLPRELLARFTRQVQPLVLNRCAAGACHGGPRGHAPLLHRDPATAADTRANAAAIRGLLGPDGDAGPLFQRLSVTHPAGATSRTLVMPPLTPRERGLLEGWLVDAGRAGDRRTSDDPAVTPAAWQEPVAARPNRFRTLLDSGLPPPPPRDPPREGGRAFTGIVDRRTAPPAAGVTPESAPPSPPPGTADSPPTRPGAPSSPVPTARGSR